MKTLYDKIWDTHLVTPETDAPALTETLPLVAGPWILGGLVLLLGLYIPPVLQDVLARAAADLGGGAP